MSKINFFPPNKVGKLQQEDLSLILQWRNNDFVRKFMFNSNVISLQDHESWFERVKDNDNKHLLMFESDNIKRGFAQFSVDQGGIAEWGFYVDPSSQRGVGGQMCKAVMQYAFNELGLYKISARVIEFNHRSLYLHNKLCFQQEGILRDHYYDGEKYHNVMCFGLIKNDWLNEGN
ncbi:UDP-4-amino-4,6-dideoxy-N-acetyl-beta-L-altrosamine N-acetyltransferase [Pantoea sp. BIGb0393]|uniref:UDP-4-amino-4, 6-dideoxy-N-acetyl-beta-L-altrosamine N-acetyltransferase n=1 Tax=Pantoea nemavictus TaxID=2726955 RepID=A0ABU8PNG2_9GAMM|nr:UDP-4-amino-4,6-dideoxy-N-acetyl-beta-L-altrosamine N-acetyltransferase [Pantoea nemavictus]MBA0035105.1 UDP-4-amino-4,6-dideoxy-N-acetyl-beta-L-altrosamine N-acetyltransferase [Pantoea nemavictus]